MTMCAIPGPGRQPTDQLETAGGRVLDALLFSHFLIHSFIMGTSSASEILHFLYGPCAGYTASHVVHTP